MELSISVYAYYTCLLHAVFPDKTQNFTQTLMEIFYSTIAYFRCEIVHVHLQHDL